MVTVVVVVPVTESTDRKYPTAKPLSVDDVILVPATDTSESVIDPPPVCPVYETSIIEPFVIAVAGVNVIVTPTPVASAVSVDRATATSVKDAALAGNEKRGYKIEDAIPARMKTAPTE